jgi:GxxExxY protein
MTENEISKIVVDTSFKIHKQLGPGLFESVYESVLFYELLNEYNLSVRTQLDLPVFWKGVKREPGFKCDMIIENKVILELKSIDQLNSVHFKQLLTYLRISNVKLGLLINFNEALLKNGIKRVANGL